MLFFTLMYSGGFLMSSSHSPLVRPQFFFFNSSCRAKQYSSALSLSESPVVGWVCLHSVRLYSTEVENTAKNSGGKITQLSYLSKSKDAPYGQKYVDNCSSNVSFQHHGHYYGAGPSFDAITASIHSFGKVFH